MKDIKVARLKNALTLSKITRISNNPPVLKLEGEKFNTATDIIMDGVYCHQWISISDKEILASVPATFSNKTIASIAVVTEELIPNTPNLIFFEAGPRVKSVEGIQKLIQNFVKILMQSPSSNKFQAVGGGLLKLSGMNMVSDDRTARSDIINGISRAKNYLLTAQAPNKQLPLAEKLLDVQVLGIAAGDNANTSLVVNLKITNRIGEDATTNVSI